MSTRLTLQEILQHERRERERRDRERELRQVEEKRKERVTFVPIGGLSGIPISIKEYERIHNIEKNKKDDFLKRVYPELCYKFYK